MYTREECRLEFDELFIFFAESYHRRSIVEWKKIPRNLRWATFVVRFPPSIPGPLHTVAVPQLQRRRQPVAILSTAGSAKAPAELAVVERRRRALPGSASSGSQEVDREFQEQADAENRERRFVRCSIRLTIRCTVLLGDCCCCISDTEIALSRMSFSVVDDCR